jgi:polygalacturonase
MALGSCFGQVPAPGSIEGSVFNVKHYGAKGDGVSSDTKAINLAIAASVRAGGGTVYVPAGTFVIGSVQLFSNINLYLESGAVLLGSSNNSDYLLQKDYGFSDYGAGNKLGLVFAVHAKNVAVTGMGTIDGNPAASLYMDSIQVSSPADWQYTRQGKNYMMSSANPAVPAYDRGEAPMMWKGLYADRPGVEITFCDCRKATLKDFTIRNAADWSIALVGCDDAKVLGITIRNNMSVPNSDGIDMYDSHDVVIADCNIRAGDDGIAVISTTNLTVTNCNITSRSSGIRIGYNAFNDDSSGNLLFDNIRIYGSNRGIGIFQRRKGDLSNMLFSNMIIDTHLYPGQWWGHGEPIHISALPGLGSKEVGTISNVRFENIIARGEEGIVVYGSPESELKDISFNNVQLTLTRGPLSDAEGGNFDLRATNDRALGVFKHDIPALYAQYVEGLTIKNLDVRWDAGLPAWFTHTVDGNHFRRLTIEGLSGATGPVGPGE